MKFRPSLPLILALLAISGCAGSNGMSQIPANAVAPTFGMSRIIVSRNNDYIGALLDARLNINGQEVGKLSRGQTYSGNFKPEFTRVSVDSWSAPGQYTVEIPAQSNMTYLLEVGGNTNSMWLGVIDSAINKNSGPFEIKLISAQSDLKQ